MMRLSDAAAATAGTLLGVDGAIAGVSTDTRRIAPGELFVALRGANFDGHDFVSAALERGAAGAMVERAWAGSQSPGNGSLVVVEDARLALGTLAGHWRQRFGLPLVGVTGSNGKTTVKEMCAAILRAQAQQDGHDPAAAVLATAGNLNNDIGVPLMLLRLRAAHRWAVIEMGMNHPGEITYLTDLVRPTVAVVNNAQHAHLEGMGSVAEVAREKGSLYAGLGSDGVAVINADDAFADYWRGLAAGRRTLTFGLDPRADVRASCDAHGLGTECRMHAPQGALAVSLRVPGLHNARNALAAAAACLAAGASLAAVKAGLEAFSGVRGRLQRRPARGGATLLDDSYNANPDSVRAAIDVLAATAGRKILVLGDMGEIGSRSGQYHDELGGYAKSQGVDRLFALGELAELAARNFGAGGSHFAGVEELVAALEPQLDADTVVLVKGSRFMRMERVANAIATDQAEGAHAA
jgi:UDP-N-acetylmuramoyl-tripeptide--D-alanyl-D-alanine ligase